MKCLFDKKKECLVPDFEARTTVMKDGNYCVACSNWASLKTLIRGTKATEEMTALMKGQTSYEKKEPKSKDQDQDISTA